MGKEKFCPHNCPYLSLTEAEQRVQGNHIPHLCKLYGNKQVKHEFYHPRLVRLIECEIE